MIQCADPMPLPDPASSDAGGWVLAILAVAALLFDWWLFRSGRPTMSQWVRRHLRRWWKFVGGVVLGGLLWHLIFGGPL